MPQARGYKGLCTIDFETEFGKDPATPAGIVLPFNKLGLQSKQNMTDPTTITGTRNPVEPIFGNIDVSGSIDVPLDLKCIGYWLKATFGEPDTTGTGSYTHKFKVGDEQPSLVIEKAFKNISKFCKYNGCKVKSLKLSFGGDGELVLSVEVMGAKETISGIAYDADPTTIVLNRLNNFQASIEEGGTSVAVVTQGDFTIDFGLDGDCYTVGSGGHRTDIPEGIVSISGNITALFKDAVLLDKAMNNTKSSLKVKFTKNTYSLEFAFNELLYERNTPAIDGPAGVKVEMPWKAFHAAHADKSAVVVTLINDVATY